MSEPKTWKEQREEKKQQQREQKIHYFPTKPFAVQPHLKNAKMQRRIEANLLTKKQREKWGILL